MKIHKLLSSLLFVLILQAAVRTAHVFADLKDKVDLKNKTINDFSKLNKTVIKDFVTPKSYNEIRDILAQAKKERTKISVAGILHSQGGHAFYKNGIVINLKNLNKIINFDKSKNILTVQTGITWKETQQFLNKHDKAIKVMQFANIFTVGGALSVNANGIDPHYGPIIETVRSIKIMLHDGRILKASRTENSELFRSAIGGYGLFGIILEAEIDITENNLYRRSSKLFSWEEYLKFIKTIKHDHDTDLHVAILPLNAGKKKLFSKVLSTSYRKIMDTEMHPNKQKRFKKMRKESFPTFMRLGVSMARKSDFIKSMQFLQEIAKNNLIMSRNNIMNPSTSYLMVKSTKYTDLLQEYFIPIDKFDYFMKELEHITRKLNFNLMHAALRFIPKNTEASLSYTKSDCLGVILMVSQEISDKGNKVTQEWSEYLINTAVKSGGTYYLTISLFADNDLIRKAYPQIDNFFKLKIKYDPNQLFMNKFYAKYSLL